MGFDNLYLLGVKTSITPKYLILEEVRKYLEKSKIQNPKSKNISKKPLVIFTPNPEIVEFAQKDGNFKRIVNCAQINIPDGQGICWAVKKLHKTKISRISGTDFMLDLCRIAQKEGLTIGLIGGRSGVALQTLECLQKKLPGLEGKALEIGKVEISDLSPPARFAESRRAGEAGNLGDLSDKITDWINKKEIDILFVALGFPKQEHFIKLLSDKVVKLSSNRPIVLMAVGGAFDYISGRVTRAPSWMRESGLEWLHRLLYEPGRWKRQLSGLQFFLRIFFK